MNRKGEKILKFILLFAFFSLFVTSCQNSNNKAVKIENGLLMLNFKTQSESTVFSDRIFGKVEMTLLETDDNYLVGGYPDLLSDAHHYFIRDYQQQIVFRFDRGGKFINSIGRQGGGPTEYVEIQDIDLIPADKIVEILDRNGKIIKFDYSGQFISSQSFGVDAFSFVKKDTDYWLYLGYENAERKRLMKVSEDGKNIDLFSPFQTNWFTITIQNFYRCGNLITYRDWCSHTLYHITDDGPVEKTIIDFGNYAFPKKVYQMKMETVLDNLRRNGMMIVDRYLENEQFVYLSFSKIQTGAPIKIYHWLVNKKTGNSVMQSFQANHMMQKADILTEDNELVFITNSQMLRDCNDPFFKINDDMRKSITDESNPIIITFKINDF